MKAIYKDARDFCAINAPPPYTEYSLIVDYQFLCNSVDIVSHADGKSIATLTFNVFRNPGNLKGTAKDITAWTIRRVRFGATSTWCAQSLAGQSATCIKAVFSQSAAICTNEHSLTLRRKHSGFLVERDADCLVAVYPTSPFCGAFNATCSNKLSLETSLVAIWFGLKVLGVLTAGT